MGTCCGHERGSIQIKDVIRVQGIARRFLTKLKASQQRKAWINQIASKFSFHYQNRKQKAFIHQIGKTK